MLGAFTFPFWTGLPAHDPVSLTQVTSDDVTQGAMPAGMTAHLAFAHADLVVPSVAELSLERLASLPHQAILTPHAGEFDPAYLYLEHRQL